MTALVFLGIVVAIAVIGSVVIAVRNRPSADANDEVANFAALMQALRPPAQESREDRR